MDDFLFEDYDLMLEEYADDDLYDDFSDSTDHYPYWADSGE